MRGGDYDIAIIGGGINGCGIARDAAGRGLSVLLAEQDDLAGGTSSASTKLVHGGLRYLEHYEFRLVRASLREREVLWRMAPHIIRPLRFVLPHDRGLRPAWLIRLGLFLYDHLGGRERLPASRSIDLTKDPAGRPLQARFTTGFEYSDCWVDDARLVVLNAVDAAKRGADIRVRTEVASATRADDRWQVGLLDKATGAQSTVSARVLVNAAGPWVGDVMAGRIGLNVGPRIRLVKGSHIVVPRLFDHDRAYIFQNADQRVIFAIPYEGDFTLIGTTDVDYDGDPADAHASEDEIRYLCSAASEYFSAAIEPAAVVWTYAGVRPLFDSGAGQAQRASRDYVLELDGRAGEPAALNVLGGKITTYRRLAEEAVEKLAGRLPRIGARWTGGAALPGGEFPVDQCAAMADELAAAHSGIAPSLAARLIRAYGTLARDVVSGVAAVQDLGTHFGADLYQREVEYLVRHEWAMTADDILWRRTKLGLRVTKVEHDSLSDWLAANLSAITTTAA